MKTPKYSCKSSHEHLANGGYACLDCMLYAEKEARSLLRRLLRAYEADAGDDNPDRGELLEECRQEVGR